MVCEEERMPPFDYDNDDLWSKRNECFTILRIDPMTDERFTYPKTFKTLKGAENHLDNHIKADGIYTIETWKRTRKTERVRVDDLMDLFKEAMEQE